MRCTWYLGLKVFSLAKFLKSTNQSFITVISAINRSSKATGTPSHHFTLAHKLSVEFRSVKREIDVEINTIESPLRRVHAFKVFLEIFTAEI